MILHTFNSGDYTFKFMKDSIGFWYSIYKDGKKVDCSYFWANSLAQSIEDAKQRIALQQICEEIRK